MKNRNTNQPSDQRAQERQEVQVITPINLVYVGSEKPVPAQVYNFTHSGIGIVTCDELPEGAKMLLVTMSRKIELKVTWNRRQGDQQLCGLEALDESIDLSLLFNGLNFKSAG